MVAMGIQEIICSLFKLGATCYSWPLDKLLVEYLLVPSVILILLLVIVTNALLRGINIKIHGLLSIVFYIIIIYSGWYGVVAPLLYNFSVLFLLGGMIFFIITRVISVEHLRALGKTGRVLGEKRFDVRLIADRIRIKRKEVKELLALAKLYAGMELSDEERKDIKDFGMSEKEIKEFKEKYGKFPISEKDFAVITMLAQEARRELDLLENQLKRSKLLAPSLVDKLSERVENSTAKLYDAVMSIGKRGEEKKKDEDMAYR